MILRDAFKNEHAMYGKSGSEASKKVLILFLRCFVSLNTTFNVLQ